MTNEDLWLPPIELIIWRHGASPANQLGIIPGNFGLALSPEGHAEAAETAIKVSTWNPGYLLSSDMQQATATAQYLAELTGLTVRLDARLREISLDSFGGQPTRKNGTAYPFGSAASPDTITSGGETTATVVESARIAVAETLVKCLDSAAAPLVVVTHAGTARALVGSLLGLSAQTWTRVSLLSNCAWSALGRDHLGWQLLGHNMCASRDICPWP